MDPTKSPDQKPTPIPTPTVIEVQPPSPRFTAAAAGAPRKVGIPVDLSDESAFAVSWAVQNYLRPNDAVTLLHVRPTSVLYGADWGSTHFDTNKLESDFDNLTAAKIAEIAKPLTESKLGYKVHVVKDHDMKERLCLEIERLGMSVVIMGSRGFGASRRNTSNSVRLGSVSDYCLHHCVCPVVVVRYPDDLDNEENLKTVPEAEDVEEEPPVAEAEVEAHDVSKLHLHAGLLLYFFTSIELFVYLFLVCRQPRQTRFHDSVTATATLPIPRFGLQFEYFSVANVHVIGVAAA